MKKGIVAILTVNMIWGIEAVAIEYLMDKIDPLVYTMIKLIVSAAVLIPIVLIKEKRLHIDLKDIPRVAACGVIGMCLYFNAENIGTEMTSAAFATMIMSMVPVFGMIFDRIWFGGRITKLKVVCVAGSIAGVFLLITGQPLGVNMKGFVVMLFAALFWASYIVIVKPLEEKYSLTTLLSAMVLAGLAAQAVITAFARPDWSGVTPGICAGVALLGIVAVVAAEYLYVFAIGKLTVTMTSLFENVFPVTSIIASFFVFHTTLAPLQLAGAAVVLVSVTVLAVKE